MTRKEKQAALKRMDKPALERIVSQVRKSDRQQRENTGPLADVVHINGIGQVPVRVLREELARR